VESAVTSARLPAHVSRIASRFAEVVCPPDVRANGRTGQVVDQFELLLGVLPRAARFALMTGLVAVDRAARVYPPALGRRFVRLPDHVAERYIGALLARPNGLGTLVVRLKGLVVLCYYDLPEAQEEIGYRPAPYIAAVSRRRLEKYDADVAAGEAAVFKPMEIPAARVPRGLTRQQDVDADIEVQCGVVVVGSGAGGATVACELADAGINVVIVEEGGYHPTESFTAEAGRSARNLYRDGGAGLAIGQPPVLFSEGRCVGGSTVVNGGMSWRTPPHVLQRWASSEGVMNIGPAEMEPYFEEVESRISVRLQDPETIGPDSELMKAGADAKGWKIIPNLRNQLHCAGTNNCTNGCPTGAKRSMLVTNIPRALSRGARLFADCRVERITRSAGVVTGVTGRFIRPGGKPGPRLTVRSAVVVVAGGAVQTPALLARSGLKSRSGQLGRNLTLHPNAKVVAFFDTEVFGWHGVHQAFQVREFMADGILIAAVNLAPPLLALGMPAHGRELGELMADYNRVVTAGCLVEDTGTGRVRNVPGVGPQVTYQITDADAARVVRGVELTAEVMFAAGARRVLLPFAGIPPVGDPGDVARLLARPIPKKAMELFTVHLMGTARMSEDPRRGVTDSFGAFHGVPGLFVADASLFPGPIGVNPMETILALATRNARRLIEQRDKYGL
jgi:choline dehydrogenase-like flavoprotein